MAKEVLHAVEERETSNFLKTKRFQDLHRTFPPFLPQKSNCRYVAIGCHSKPFGPVCTMKKARRNAEASVPNTAKAHPYLGCFFSGIYDPTGRRGSFFEQAAHLPFFSGQCLRNI